MKCLAHCRDILKGKSKNSRPGGGGILVGGQGIFGPLLREGGLDCFDPSSGELDFILPLLRGRLDFFRPLVRGAVYFFCSSYELFSPKMLNNAFFINILDQY